jgi:molecular chaperone DnaK
VTLKISESRVITTNLYIPLLDEEFEEILDLRSNAISAPDITADFEREKVRLQSLLGKANDTKINGALEEIKSSDLMNEIKEAVAGAKGDPDAAAKAEKRLLELKLKLDAIENELKWPTSVTEIQNWLADLSKLATEHGSEDQQDRAAELKEEADEIITEKKVDRLNKKLKQVQDLYYQILFSLKIFWVQQFQKLEKERTKMKDKAKADRLFEMGQRYLDQNNADGLRNVVGQLWELLPRQVVEQVQRGFGANLTL